MKNLINYYYNLVIKEFKKTEDSFSFEINKIKYTFLPYMENIDEMYKIYTLLINNYKYCHEIVLNKDNSIVTFYENIPYILLKNNIQNNNILTIKEILEYDSIAYDNNVVDWKKLWKEKIDYYEYQVNQFGFKFPIIRESFSYYLGLSEIAISILNYVNKQNIKTYICHKRINYNERNYDFLNPLNIIIDNRTRDIAEYYKVKSINENTCVYEIINQIKSINLNKDEAIMLLSRLMYPSYYFDIYDKIIQEKTDEKKIKFLIKKNEYYETFLKQIYSFLRQKYSIIEIEFLEN